MPRTRKPRLTVREKRLLEFPPNMKTWECRLARPSLLDPSVKMICGGVNAGNEMQCWMCASKRPAKPKLFWPEYVKACEKVGIEPGQAWRPAQVVVSPATRKNVRRKA